MLTAEMLREVLHYDRATGEFVWRKKTGKKVVVGRRAGHLRKTGYRMISVCGRMYLAHRLAWLYVTGNWPSGIIDHANGDGDDNKWSNLREATQAENVCNAKRRVDNSSGYKGTSFHKKIGRYHAYINVNKKRINLGFFETAEEAHSAYLKAAKANFGQFARAS